MPGRDYLAEMNAAIDAALPDGDYVAPLVAHDLVEKLLATDPDLLHGWCEARYEPILADFIHHKVKARRSASREASARAAFAEAAGAFVASGDALALREAVRSPFDAEYVVNGDLLRRKVRDMVGADHLFVASEYAESKQTAALLESFHRAVAKKVGGKRTSEVFTEETYLAMYRSITRQDSVAA
ncbi:MAG TPA: hypothetical protein VIN75_26060 [Burkholderiaceae bacterium]